MKRLEIGDICTFVPDDSEMNAKGLDKSTKFDVIWRFVGTEQKVGHFRLETMPGCCGVVVSTDSYLEEKYRAGNMGDLFHELKAKTAKEFGYGVMLSTTQLRNIPQVVSASKNGWKFFHLFRNKRTDNDIGIAVKVLK